METDARTGSTIVLTPSPRPARAAAGAPSNVPDAGLSGEGPSAGPEAGPVEDLVARLIRQMMEFGAEGGSSLFQAQGLDPPISPDDPDPEEPSRFEAPGCPAGEAGGDPDPIDASRFEMPRIEASSASDDPAEESADVQRDEPITGLVRQLVDLFDREGGPRSEEIASRYPQLPGRALRLIAREAELRRGDCEPPSSAEIDPCQATAESGLAGPPAAAAFRPGARDRTGRFPSVGETVGDYRLLAALGRGVRGAVFLADQPSLANRPVVLKMTARDGREHLSLAQLQHPHIVPLYCVQDIPGRDLRLLCMPYRGGAPLSRILAGLDGIPIARRTGRDVLDVLDRAEAPLSVPVEGPARRFLARASYIQAVCWIGACLADALQFAHGRELVHLDLKPSNVLLAADGTPMLLDFHLAQRPIRPDDSGHRWLGGTPPYMSPEQRMAMTEIHDGEGVTAEVDGRTDIYALGLMLYRMLGGAITIGPYPIDRIAFRRRAGVPVGLGDIVARCLAFDPAHRYPDAARLADDLRRQLADRPLVGVRNRSPIERWRKWCRRHPHVPARMGRFAVVTSVLLVAGWLVALGDSGQRLRGAASLLAEGRRQIEQGDDPAAELALKQGLSLIDGSWLDRLGRPSHESRDLRHALEAQLARLRRAELADELHHLADRLRILYGTELPQDAALRALDRRLQSAWRSRERFLDRVASGLDDGRARRLRTDLLDLGILRADLRVRLADASEKIEARREALRILDEAERLFGPSPVLAIERRAQAQALGLTDVAGSAARSRKGLAPKTAWEHYALGRSLLAAGDLDSAAREFDRATELQPQDLWAQLSRGLCAYRRRQFEIALRAFEVCVALSPTTAECYLNRGLAHAALGHVELARRDREHAMHLASGAAPAANPRVSSAARPPGGREASGRHDRWPVGLPEGEISAGPEEAVEGQL